MINIIPTTDWDRQNRPKNYSQLLNEDEWYAVVNELGEVNERTEEAWCITEIFKMVQQISISGDWEYATTHDFQKIFDILETQYKNQYCQN